MLTSAFNKIIKRFLQVRSRRIEYFKKNPILAQQKIFNKILDVGANTLYGQQYEFNIISNQHEYATKVPLIEYDDIKPMIDRMMLGEENILWKGRVKWYSKSSGTTGKSKFIPVSNENLKNCHIRSSWDALSILYQKNPEARVFADKNLVMAGSLQRHEHNPETIIGDVSAIMLYNIPTVGRPFYSPDIETGLLDDWEEKLAKMTKICSQDNISLFGGVPTWTVVLFKKILNYTGKSNMLEVWPNVQAYIHGGVGFDPYVAQFKEFFPGNQLQYQEVYNASEGYFGIQDLGQDDGLLLLLDNGTYYEFIELNELNSNNPRALSLQEVEVDKTYALVISTNSGLSRYLPGDTIRFTSLDPYRIKVAGRIKQFINVFGEEVMVSNTDKALAETCKKHNAIVSEYTVAPIHFGDKKQAGHEWLIEFEILPQHLDGFEKDLDQNLQRLNSDYEAKRFKNLALQQLKLRAVPRYTFVKWMKQNNRMGAQTKIPRLSNSRTYVDNIIEFLKFQDIHAE